MLNVTAIRFSDAEAAELRREAGVAEAAPSFCQEWPVARKVLSGLATVIPNPLAKAAIGIVIAAGDAFCPGEKQ